MKGANKRMHSILLDIRTERHKRRCLPDIWCDMGMIRYNTLKAKKEKHFTSIRIIPTKNLLTPRKQAKQNKAKQRKKNKAKQSKQNKASIRQGRQNSPKTRKPLHLPIQGLLSEKNGDYLLSHCYAVPSAWLSLTSLFGMGRGGTSVL